MSIRSSFLIRATPHRSTYDFERDRLYITDRFQPTIYVLDTIPRRVRCSKTLKRIRFRIGRLRVEDCPILFSHDTSRFYVGIPDPNELDGKLYVITVDNPDAPTLLAPAPDRALIVDVGPDPYRFTRTDDRNVIVVVDRTSDPHGVGLIKYDPENEVHEPAAFIDLNTFTPTSIDRPIGITNPSDVVFIPADALKDPKSKDPEIANGHPAYILVSSFNRFNIADPKHNPNLGPYLLGDGRYVDTDGKIIFSAFAAGSNIGVII